VQAEMGEFLSDIRSIPRPLSDDLRRRILEAYQRKEGSQRQLAQRFGVSFDYVRKIRRQWRQSGKMERVGQLRHGPQSRNRNIAEVSSPHEAFDLVRENAGMAFLPLGVCEELPAGIRAVTIDDLPSLQTVLVHRPNCPSFIPTLAERLRRYLRKQANHNGGQKK